MQAVDGRLGTICSPQLRPFAQVRKGYTYFAEGDVLFAKITPCMQNGKHAIARDLIGGFGFGTTEFHVLRPSLAITPDWIHFFIRQPEVLENAKAYFTGAVGQQRVPESYLANLEIPVPPVEAQKRITAVLKEQMAALERARAAAEARLEAAKALPAAYFREAFRGATPLSVGPPRDAAPPGWRWVLLTKVARLESGHTPSRYHPEWWGGDVPWIALPDIRSLDGKVAYETSEYTNEAGIANSSARVLPAGTVVLSRTASVGFVTVMGREMATSQDFVDWICGPDMNPHFLAYVLRASRDFIRSLSSGAIHQTVYVPTVKRFEVCLPSRAEQESIVKVLSNQLTVTGRARKAIEEELDTINKLPAALLRRAFIGGL
jgi:type I restriction enzyme S subunit